MPVGAKRGYSADKVGFQPSFHPLGYGRATPAAAVHHHGREDALREVTATVHDEGPHRRDAAPAAQGPVAERARRVNGEYRREGARSRPLTRV